MHNTLGVHCEDVETHFHSLLVRYELVLGSFEVRFQFGMSSLNDRIRRMSSAYVCVLEILSFL